MHAMKEKVKYHLDKGTHSLVICLLRLSLKWLLICDISSFFKKRLFPNSLKNNHLL